jgi:hypothetical protein
MFALWLLDVGDLLATEKNLVEQVDMIKPVNACLRNDQLVIHGE